MGGVLAAGPVYAGFSAGTGRRHQYRPRFSSFFVAIGAQGLSAPPIAGSTYLRADRDQKLLNRGRY